ncbi:Thioredoxin-like protein Clot [Lachnellula cervina]|uniref:Thioredoxin-like protein Clot n=1 Tax=Lachnellula cervina TaxID=1316786 RepID=A0A7D8USQ3_9HELO|nr:Thioredoxin-like protein Clot [Lachnellula cervina]
MPLHVSTESPSAIAQSLESSSSKPSFLVVYASHVDGKSWCGDCRDAEPLVDAKFADRAYDVKVVYAGLKDEWRKADNPWKQAPFSVTNLPTLIKVTGNASVKHEGKTETNGRDWWKKMCMIRRSWMLLSGHNPSKSISDAKVGIRDGHVLDINHAQPREFI